MFVDRIPIRIDSPPTIVFFLWRLFLTHCLAGLLGYSSSLAKQLNPHVSLSSRQNLQEKPCSFRSQNHRFPWSLSYLYTLARKSSRDGRCDFRCFTQLPASVPWQIRSWCGSFGNTYELNRYFFVFQIQSVGNQSKQISRKICLKKK